VHIAVGTPGRVFCNFKATVAELARTLRAGGQALAPERGARVRPFPA
jgi:hypothetical protein